jgi:hypothetical protein
MKERPAHQQPSLSGDPFVAQPPVDRSLDHWQYTMKPAQHPEGASLINHSGLKTPGNEQITNHKLQTKHNEQPPINNPK